MEPPPDYNGKHSALSSRHASRDIQLNLTDDISSHDGQSIRSLKSPQPSSTNGYCMQVESAPYRRLEHPADRSLLVAFIASLIFLISALIVLAPGVVIIFGILPVGLLIRNCLSCCCCCHPNKSCACCCTHFMSHSDAVWLHDTDVNRSLIQVIMTLERGVDLAQVRHLLNARLVTLESKNGRRLYPRFMQRIVPLYAGYSWVHDHEFSLDNHVYPMPARIRTKAELQQYVGQQAAHPLSRDRPLWEVQVLPDYGESRDTVMLFRIHPCVSDGISLIQILQQDVADVHAVEPLKPRFGHSALIINMIRAVIIGPLVFVQKWLLMRGDYNILCARDIGGDKVVSWSQPYSMAAATRVKQVTRSSFNDVILCVVSGTLRHYMRTRGVLHPYDLTASIPVDLRADGEEIMMGNYYTYVDLLIPTNTEGSIPRLWEIKHQMEELKNSADAVVLYGAQWVMSNVMPECLYQRILRYIWDKGSCTITSVPGPTCKLQFGSREIRSIIATMSPPASLPLSISVVTYGDDVRMCVVADKSVLPNPAVLTAQFNKEFAKLSELLANRRIPGEHPRHTHIDTNHGDDPASSGPNIAELQSRMHVVQLELQDLKSKLDTPEGEEGGFSDEQQALFAKVELLKEEFRDLLLELRRKKSSQGSAVSDDEEDNDGELRRSSYRKRTMSTASRRSIVSITSTARPLTTSPPPHGSGTMGAHMWGSQSSTSSSSSSPPLGGRARLPSSPAVPTMVDHSLHHHHSGGRSPSSDQQRKLLGDDVTIKMSDVMNAND